MQGKVPLPCKGQGKDPKTTAARHEMGSELSEAHLSQEESKQLMASARGGITRKQQEEEKKKKSKTQALQSQLHKV